MAANYFKAVHHHQLRRRHSIDCPRSSSSSSSSSSAHFLKPITTQTPTSSPSSSSSSSSANTTVKSLFRSIFTTFAVSSTTTVPSTSNNNNISFDVLEQHLSAKNFRQADEETRRLLILLAGESAQKRGYVFFSEVQFISESDLKTIDELWRKYSDEKFGYSVQKKIWNRVNRDFTKFFLKVGWMKKLDTEIEQYNYRSFPNEFIWEMTDDDGSESPPDGHLPLTNALRGTQLLNSILNHPAFQSDDDVDDNADVDGENGGENGALQRSTTTDDKPLNKSRLLKPDYSF